MHPYHELIDAARRGEAHVRELAKRSAYLREYISQKKTATRVAQDFAQALKRAKGHAAEAELTAVYNTFDADST
jgi:hypothetical protein